VWQKTLAGKLPVAPGGQMTGGSRSLTVAVLNESPQLSRTLLKQEAPPVIVDSGGIC